ncbi:hypothetical protein K0C01_07145 [Salinarchaeum sp. IM2453]|uniref:hypothetical protein n=1 Tax=Salinarchaeum sp. IM2453 TaxID=2862870 RepID=UPI001C82C89B|nr:hypothetical protein [Salinarchaeum sp. IM2453]QZA87591.1 hypothetical protein K0C01_07145 [Salinarchaeum sp. IM2453]
MSHRVLIAIEVAPDTFDLYRCSWGGQQLLSKQQLYQFFDHPFFDPQLVVDLIPYGELCDHIDWLLDEVLYIITQSAQIDRFFPVPLTIDSAIPGKNTADGPGILVQPPSSDPTGDRLRARIDSLRAFCRLLTDREVTDPSTLQKATVELLSSWSQSTVISKPDS